MNSENWILLKKKKKKVGSEGRVRCFPTSAGTTLNNLFHKQINFHVNNRLNFLILPRMAAAGRLLHTLTDSEA